MSAGLSLYSPRSHQHRLYFLQRPKAGLRRAENKIRFAKNFMIIEMGVVRTSVIILRYTEGDPKSENMRQVDLCNDASCSKL